MSSTRAGCTWMRDDGLYETTTSIGIREGTLFRLSVAWYDDAEEFAAVVYFFSPHGGLRPWDDSRFGKWTSGVPVPDESLVCDPEFWDVMAKAYLDGTEGSGEWS